jgi:hypothetical protein
MRRRPRRLTPLRWDGREGIYFDGRWWPCGRLAEVAGVRMARIDRLPRWVRDELNMSGNL